MKQRQRIYYSAAQRAEIWDRWQRGESMSSIGRLFDWQSSSIFSVLSPSGGIRPAERGRSGRAPGPTSPMPASRRYARHASATVARLATVRIFGEAKRIAPASLPSVTQRSMIRGRHRDRHMLAIARSLGSPIRHIYELAIIGHYGKYNDVLRCRNAG